jgi:hypothetical protein
VLLPCGWSFSLIANHQSGVRAQTQGGCRELRLSQIPTREPERQSPGQSLQGN